MKNQQSYSLILSSLMLLAISACSSLKEAQDQPLPPEPITTKQPIILPQPGNPTQAGISESAAAQANESTPTRYKKIIEERGPGGAVNKIIVDNPGNIPDYYLKPETRTTDSTSNPDKLSTPNWQWSW